jgi:hypothetical protein
MYGHVYSNREGQEGQNDLLVYTYRINQVHRHIWRPGWKGMYLKDSLKGPGAL